MTLSIEVSHYAFDADFVPKVQAFIDELHTHYGITVVTNAMSTQIFGEFDSVMSAYTSAMKSHFNNSGAGAFVAKFLNCDARQYTPNA
jgi:uncharacterized protein YqgV (UPF0045/DUF77 family)